MADDGLPTVMADDGLPTGSLSQSQKARIAKNKQCAIALRNSRLHPYKNDLVTRTNVVASSRLIDSGAGFLIEPGEEVDPFNVNDVIEEAAPLLSGNDCVCLECCKAFSGSYLMKNFDCRVCDGCRDKERHKLITRTDAKQRYCLKDCDFDVRTPPLRYILKKNPHNDRWGDMKLYLETQVHKRALEVWETEGNIEEQRDKRVVNKEKSKSKRFEKRIKDLRDSVRTSMWHKDLSKHEHVYDSENEVYDEDKDVYTKKCKSCDHVLKYEKM